MKNLLFSLFAMLMLAVPSLAQTIKVTGTVMDKEMNESVIGAAVLEIGTQNGTVTDMDGKFTLTVKKGAKLRISCIGYAAQELVAQEVMNIEMGEDAQIMQEMVVTGYQVQRKADLTGAVGVMDMKLPKSEGSNNIVNSMQGRMPGVNVITDPAPGGGGSSIQIRGMSSFYGNNAPLLVIDGVATTENLNSINPADIESLQVLKDASSASIYGSRAANGVIIITTKSGKGDKMKIDLGYSASANFIAKKHHMMNAQQWGTAYYQAAKNSGVTPYNDWFTYDSNGNAYLNPYVAGHDGQAGYQLANTDWQKEVYQTSWTHNVNASISNSGEKGTVLFSANYMNQNGIMKESNYERYTARLNSTYKFNKYISVGENLMIARWSDNIGSTGDDNSVAYRAMAQFPGMPVFQGDGSYSSSTNILKSDKKNALHELHNQRDNNNASWRIFGNAYLQINPIQDLTIKSNFGIDHLQYTTDVLNRRIDPTDENSVSRSYGSGDTYTWTNTANYNHNWGGKHTLNLLGGVESIGYFSDNFSAMRKDYHIENDHYMVLGAGTSTAPVVGGGKTDWALFSNFWKADYNYDDRYLLAATIRYDKTSRLGKKNNSGVFPAFSGAWRISQEKFWEPVTAVSDLKLRLAWGQNGNSAISDYASYTTYAANAGTAYDIYGTGNTFESGLTVAATGADDLKWETTSQFNLGLDARFLSNALGFSADFYVKKTKDMLTMPPTMAAEGQNAMRWRNTGDMRNIGIEATLDYRSKQYGDFSWEGSFNISHYRSKITTLYDNQTYIGDDIRLVKGESVGTYYGYVCDGIFQTAEEVANHAKQQGAAPGRLIYRDLNGDGEINENDRCKIGKGESDFGLGLNLDLHWKKLTLSMFFTGEFGFDIRNITKSQLNFFSYGVTATNRGTSALNAWTKPGDKTSVPALSLTDDNNETKYLSTYNLEDGSYLKMKYIKLSYELPENICKKFMATKLNVFAQLENVFTATGYSGLDPELQRNMSAYGTRIDNSPFPRNRTFSMGINLSF